jgi:hypothetical protein
VLWHYVPIPIESRQKIVRLGIPPFGGSKKPCLGFCNILGHSLALVEKKA